MNLDTNFKQMKKLIIILFATFISTIIHAQSIKVGIDYKQDEVFVILNEKLIGTMPPALNVDFDLGGEIIFYKKGYYSHRVEIDINKPFRNISIDLIKKEGESKISVKCLLLPDTLVISKIVTNFTTADLKEELDNNFIENNYFIGKSVELFPEAQNEIQNSRFKIAIDVIDQNQLRGIYKAPRFMMGYIKIRWALLDNLSNKVVFFKETEGTHFIKIKKPKGLVVSKLMKKVMIEAIKEAQIKLLVDPEFKKIIDVN